MPEYWLPSYSQQLLPQQNRSRQQNRQKLQRIQLLQELGSLDLHLAVRLSSPPALILELVIYAFTSIGFMESEVVISDPVDRNGSSQRDCYSPQTDAQPMQLQKSHFALITDVFVTVRSHLKTLMMLVSIYALVFPKITLEATAPPPATATPTKTTGQSY